MKKKPIKILNNDEEIDAIYKQWLLSNQITDPKQNKQNIQNEEIKKKTLFKNNKFLNEDSIYIKNIFISDYMIIDEKYYGISWDDIRKHCFFLKLKYNYFDEFTQAKYQYSKIKYKKIPIKIINFINKEKSIFLINYKYKSNLYKLMYDFHEEKLIKNITLLNRNSEFTINYLENIDILEIQKQNIDINLILNGELALNIDIESNFNMIKNYTNYFLSKNNLNFLIELENFNYKKNKHINDFKIVFNNWLNINTYQKPVYELVNYELCNIELDDIYIYKILFDKIFIYNKTLIGIILNDVYVLNNDFNLNELNIFCLNILKNKFISILINNKNNIINQLLNYVNKHDNKYNIVYSKKNTSYYIENFWFINLNQTNYRKNKKFNINDLRILIKNENTYLGILLYKNFLSFHKNLDFNKIDKYQNILYIFRKQYEKVVSLKIDTIVDFSKIINYNYMIENLDCRLYMPFWEDLTETIIDFVMIFDEIVLIFIWNNLYIMKLEIDLIDYDFDEYTYFEEEILEKFFPLIVDEVLKKGGLAKLVAEDTSLTWIMGVDDSIFETKSDLNRDYINSHKQTKDDLFFERSGLLFTETKS